MGELTDRLAKRIRSLRGDVPQMHFCKKLGISNTSLHRIESGRQNVTLETIELLCKRLNCSVGFLLDDPKEVPLKAGKDPSKKKTVLRVKKPS